MNETADKTVFTVSVRDLVEFALRTGDLGGERLFVGSDRALAGIRGHQKIQRSRPAGYQTEIPIEYDVDAGEFVLRIRGRIDGLLETPRAVLLEEIKTVQGQWDQAADPLHWAQAKFYGYIHAAGQSLADLGIRLVYLQLETDSVTEFRQTFSISELSEFFIATTGIYLDWLREEHRWARQRDRSIRDLAFPFPSYRAGQRELAVVTYRVLANGGRLYLAAPTGIGKTMSVLFPAIKALGEGKLERIFYLTARTVGRAVAEKAVTDLRRGGLQIRSLTLTAKEKICVRDGHPCDSLTCPLTKGYYDRLKPAIREALNHAEITRPVIETIGLKHQVCPFELSLDISVWVDVVICDYNYAFDPQVYLRRHFAEEGGDYAFLVDEAHNLVDRAREMFSADLDGHEIQEVRRAIKTAVPWCARALNKLLSVMRQLGNPIESADEIIETSDPSTELNLFPARGLPTLDSKEEANIIRELPDDLIDAIESALTEAEAWLVLNRPAEFHEQLLTLYFRLRSFERTAGFYDERYVTIVDPTPHLRVRLFCLDPSHLLRTALERCKSAVFFSATLTPIDYYRTILGGSPEDPVLQLASPFPTENLAVLVHDRIQTHFKGRSESIGDVAAAIATLVEGRRGNYLVYFPSFQYLNDVLQEFQRRHANIPVLVQKPGMSESEREAFLAAFAVEHGDTLVGFAVMGGVFGEGIDLVGEHLIGAVIVGVGLPQLCVERNLIRDYFQQQNSLGFEYAYTFPGMNRVLQAVGRVIRSETDRGVALLIDTRFGETRYRRLFPLWWKYVRVRQATAIKTALESFWGSKI
jgi:DNA excision repair protein ERCC-2